MLNSERKRSFGLRGEDGPPAGPETPGCMPRANNRVIQQLPGNRERERERAIEIKREINRL